jgi:tripartite-type tricarboxylate transporter receptor subunit TctC
MRLTRRSVIAGAAALPFAAGAGRAQSWPSGAVRLLIPFPPGGSTDALARLVQTGLQQRLGANIIIENKPGASGTAGTTIAAKSAPDGTTPRRISIRSCWWRPRRICSPSTPSTASRRWRT